MRQRSLSLPPTDEILMRPHKWPELPTPQPVSPRSRAAFSSLGRTAGMNGAAYEDALAAGTPRPHTLYDSALHMVRFLQPTNRLGEEIVDRYPQLTDLMFQALLYRELATRAEVRYNDLKRMIEEQEKKQ